MGWSRGAPAHRRIERGHAVLATDLAVLLVSIIWGSSYVVMQVVGETVPVAAFLALRFLLAIPVIVIFALRTLSRLTRVELTTGVLFGCLLYGILILETTGVRYTSAANSGFLISVSVVLVPVFEKLISKRSQPRLVYFATVLALTGCGLLTLSHGFRPKVGDLIIIAAAMIRAFQITLFGRRTSGTAQSLLNVTLVEFVVVALLATTTAAVAGEPVWGVAGTVGATAWWLIAYLALLGTSYAFLVQLWAARRSSSTRVGIVLCTEPFFAAIFAVVAAGESLGPVQLLGGGLVVFAAFLGRAVEGSRPGPRTAGRHRYPRIDDLEPAIAGDAHVCPQWTALPDAVSRRTDRPGADAQPWPSQESD